MAKNKGQVMLLTVVVIGGLLLSASAIAGLLMLYQIRQSTDIINSTKAIFAADTGIEWELYKCFKCNPSVICDQTCTALDSQEPSMTNGADFDTTVYGTNTIKSIGNSFQSSRAFEITLE